MHLIHRVVSSRPRLSVYFLVDGDFRSAGFYTLMELLSESPEMYYNPNFLDNTSPRVTLELIAEAPDFESFYTLHPELFI